MRTPVIERNYLRLGLANALYFVPHDDSGEGVYEVFDYPTGDFAWSFWVNTRATNQRMMIKGSFGGKGGIRVEILAGVILFRIYYVTGGVSTVLLTVTSTATISDGQWHHVVLTNNRNNADVGERKLHVWIDSVVASSATINPALSGESITCDNGFVYISSTPGNPSSPMAYSDMRHFNRHLTAAEVASLYAGGDVTDGMVGHWPLDDGDNCLVDQHAALWWARDTVDLPAISRHNGSLNSRHPWAYDPPRRAISSTLLGTILAWADTHHISGDGRDTTYLDPIIAWGNQFPLDLVIGLGDTLVTGGTPATAFDEIVASLDIVRGGYGNPEITTEKRLVVGNHDVGDGEAMDAATFLAAACAAGLMDDEETLYYSFDLTGLHCTVLYCDTEDNDYVIDQTQLDWLAADLAAATMPVIVFLHVQAGNDRDGLMSRSTDGALVALTEAEQVMFLGNASTVRAILEAAGNVMLVVSGHRHSRRFGRVNGIYYLTVSQAIAYQPNAALIQVYSDGTIAVNGIGDQPTLSRR